MSISRQDVIHLAELARLELTAGEISSAEKELETILGFVDRLKVVNTDGIESASMPATNVWREDVVQPCDDVTRALILSNFPARKGDLLATPGVFERPKGSKS